MSHQFYAIMNNKLRKKLRHVIAKVDNKAPHFNASAYLKPHDLQRDALRVKEIDRENIKLLKKINVIHRLGVSIIIFYLIKTNNLFIIYFVL